MECSGHVLATTTSRLEQNRDALRRAGKQFSGDSDYREVMKVYITRPVFDEAIDRLRREFEVQLNDEDRILSKRELIQHLRDKDGALTLLTDAIDLEVLQPAPQLKAVPNFAVGFTNVWIDWANKLAVAVRNTPAVRTETT